MLLHINNEMENGIIAKIPLALDKDLKGFQGDAIDFEVSSPDRQLVQAEDLHPYKSLFKILSGTAELKNLYFALSFNLTFSTPDGRKTGLTRPSPTESWTVSNGEYYCDNGAAFGFTSVSKFSGNYSANLTNPYLYIIKSGNLIDNKMSNGIAIRAQFYPASTFATLTPKENIGIILTGRQNMNEPLIPVLPSR